MDFSALIVRFDYIIRYVTKIFDKMLKILNKGTLFPTDPENNDDVDETPVE